MGFFLLAHSSFSWFLKILAKKLDIEGKIWKPLGKTHKESNQEEIKSNLNPESNKIAK